MLLENLRLTLIQLLLLSFLVPSWTTTVKDFSGGAFTIKPRDGLYFIDIGMGNLEGGNLLASFGDFNGDKYTDIVTLSNDNRTAKVYLWNDDAGAFNLYASVVLGDPIISIISVDMDDNGDDGTHVLDLLITTDPGDHETYNTQLFKQEADNSSFEANAKLIISSSHPTILDIDGNHQLDILYLDPTSKERMIATLNSSGENFQTAHFSDYVSKANGCLNYSEYYAGETPSFASPHYNSFVDINGDCRADIFLTAKSSSSSDTLFEFWLKQSDGTFCLANVSRVPAEVKGVSFADIDFDGGVDMIVASEDSTNVWLELYFNNMAPNTDSMCVLRSNQQISPFDRTDSNYIKYSMIDNLNNNYRLFSLNSNVPSAIRVGDIDADTYPDLLMTFYNKENITEGQKTYLFKNMDCSDACPNSSHKRYFRYNPSENSFNTILEESDAANATFATFMDIGEMGSLDIILTRVDQGDYKITAIFNYLNPDTFFLKALGLNGFTVGSTGGIYYGSTFQCVITTLDGDQKLSNNVQLFQSGYNALQLPYAFIGLGRTNNYVENFYLGMPQNTSFTKSWTPIIPNSQLIVYPNSNNPDNWSLDIYVNPTKATIIVVISTASILFIIGIVILYLHKKEKEEDKTYQEQFQQFFR